MKNLESTNSNFYTTQFPIVVNLFQASFLQSNSLQKTKDSRKKEKNAINLAVITRHKIPFIWIITTKLGQRNYCSDPKKCYTLAIQKQMIHCCCYHLNHLSEVIRVRSETTAADVTIIHIYFITVVFNTFLVTLQKVM